MTRATKPGAKHAPSTMRRKSLILDQAKIDRAKRILRAATETEAIHRVLDAVSDLGRFGLELDEGLKGVLGRGGFVDLFDVLR